jgi:hypothetical protein
MSNIELVIYSDPSHAWGQVPHSLIHDLGIAKDISSYSYQDDKCAYLEEDCDLALFLDKAKDKGLNITFRERHFDHDCAIRNYPRYV